MKNAFHSDKHKRGSFIGNENKSFKYNVVNTESMPPEQEKIYCKTENNNFYQ